MAAYVYRRSVRILFLIAIAFSDWIAVNLIRALKAFANVKYKDRCNLFCTNKLPVSLPFKRT